MSSIGTGSGGQVLAPPVVVARASPRLFILVPIGLATGIALYFFLAEEPTLWQLAGFLGFGGVGVLGSHRIGDPGRNAMLLLSMVMVGVGWTGLRAEMLRAHVLPSHYFGPIEGRIVQVDRSSRGALRITLDAVRIDAAQQPKHVRVTLRGGVETALTPGLRVMTTGHLAPPGAPVEPGGFDFRRHAWFLQLGGVGWTTAPLLRTGDDVRGRWLTRQRMALSARIQSKLTGQEGAVAAALLTGDRSGLSAQTLEDLRATNLAHLLAISGLHMGLVAGICFWAVQRVLVWVPGFALNHRVDKYAAFGALIAASLYLGLSGVSVATERAYIMTAVALAAIILDRPVLSLRVISVAAFVVLARRPETLISPGFQMSFAATFALIAVFREMHAREMMPNGRWHGVASLALASLVAGLATLPFAAAHFNRIPTYGFPANLLSTPLMGVWIMPSGLVALLLAPIGLDGPALWVMGKGIAWILAVADFIAELPNSVRPVMSPPSWLLAAISLGTILALIARTMGRFFGMGLVATSLCWWWGFAERPPILISEDRRLIGVLTEDGRALNRPRGNGYVARIWLENDGDLADQAQAASRDIPRSLVALGEDGPCVLMPPMPQNMPANCVDLSSYEGQGALAIWPEEGRVISVEHRSGNRPWANAQ